MEKTRMKKPLLSALAAAFILAGLQGCTATPVDASAESKEKEYVTGSNIPRKDKMGVKTMSKDELDMLQQRPGAPYNPDRP